MKKHQNPRKKTVVYGVTVGTSAYSFLRGQLAWMQDRGWNVHFVSSPDVGAKAAAEREDVCFHPVVMERKMSLLADVKSLVEWVSLLTTLRPTAINVGTPKAGLVGTLAAMICRVPRRIYVLRGLRLESARGLAAALLWCIEWLTIRAATDVVVVSRSLGLEARRRRLLPAHRCWLVGEGSSNGVPWDLIRKRLEHVDRKMMRKSLGFDDDDFVVGYVGRITQDKGIDTLKRAFSRIPSSNLRLLLVGPVEDRPSQECLDYLGSRAVHVDWTDDVWRYYAAMDCFCLPARREGFPNVVLEAASAGLPTITTTATGAIDSVVDNVTGRIVPMDDYKALAAAIMFLAENRGLANQLGIAALRRARDVFDPEHIWSGIESLLCNAPLPHVTRV